MDETIAQIIQNGNDSNDEHLDGVNYGDELTLEPVPIKRTKLDVPAFLQKQPIQACWQPVKPAKPNKNLGIESICPNICFFFLRDDCIEGENCYYLHELPPDAEVTRALAECGVENAAKLLTVVFARCPKLLRRYFHVFVTFFANQNAADELIAAIGICQRETDKATQFQYFQHLIEAFIRIGKPYATAMETIFWHLDYHKQKDVVDTLLNMGLVDGIGVSEFLCVFESLNEQHFPFNAVIINRLMFLCTQSENALSAVQLAEFVRLIYTILRNNNQKQTAKELDTKCYTHYIRLYNRLRQTKWMVRRTTSPSIGIEFQAVFELNFSKAKQKW